MAEVVRTKFVRAGSWTTLEYGWNVSFTCRFRDPAGAQVKVRYGYGWFSWDSQKKTLDGKDKNISVGKASVAYARVQMKVQRDEQVTYVYIPT